MVNVWSECLKSDQSWFLFESAACGWYSGWHATPWYIRVVRLLCILPWCGWIPSFFQSVVLDACLAPQLVLLPSPTLQPPPWLSCLWWLDLSSKSLECFLLIHSVGSFMMTPVIWNMWAQNGHTFLILIYVQQLAVRSFLFFVFNGWLKKTMFPEKVCCFSVSYSWIVICV